MGPGSRTARIARGGLTLVAAAAIAVGGLPAAAGDSPAIRFENVTEASGLAFVLDQHPTADKHMVETMAGGLAAFDYDGDGLLDVYFTNGATLPSLSKATPAQWNRLYRNEGGLRFTDVTERAGVQGDAYATGAAAGDYDGDGDVDLFVAGVRRNQLFRNDGNGRFTDVTAAAGIASYTWSVAAGWLDYDNDGRLDLFIVNYVDWRPEANKYCGDRTRGIRVYCHPKNYDGLPNALFRNRGDGTFEDASARSGIGKHIGKGMSVAFADYDADGHADIFVTNDALPDFLFHNRRDGTFEEVGLLAGVSVPAHGRPISSMGVDFRDYDNDGRPDLHVTALAGETLPLFRNVDGTSFQDVTFPSGLGATSVRLSGWGTVLVDLDNDGFKDLVTANSHANDRIEQFESVTYRQPNAIFRNVGGRFQDVSAQAGPDFAVSRANRGVAAADFDRDGRVDLLFTALGERAQLLRNVGGDGHHWLRVTLAGGRSNRGGVGARVHLGSQWNHVTSAVGYASSVVDGVHFGLGAETKIERLEVIWPSGTKQTLTDVPVDQQVVVKEPAGP